MMQKFVQIQRVGVPLLNKKWQSATEKNPNAFEHHCVTA